MFIKCGDEFLKFKGFSKKLSDSLDIVFDNSRLKCSVDHRFKDKNGQDIFAKDLQKGDTVKNNQFGLSTVIQITPIGQHTVFTPVDVEGGLYETLNGLINHNCSFIGSSATLISGDILEKLTEKEPIEVLFSDLSLSIYEKPIPNALYVMGVDCATGVGNDYCVVQVVKILSKTEMYQVACYRSNTVETGEFSRVIDQLSKMYNDAYFIIESNDTGKTVAEEVWYTLENMHLINTEKSSRGLGTIADKRSKLDACMELRRVMNAEILHVCDSKTIEELSRFEEQRPNVFAAAKGNHDDTVSALYWAMYATMQPEIDMDNIRQITNQQNEENMMTVDMMVNDMANEDDFWGDFK
jgi:hypothetical protein